MELRYGNLYISEIEKKKIMKVMSRLTFCHITRLVWHFNSFYD